jgi:hypothetical protein
MAMKDISDAQVCTAVVDARAAEWKRGGESLWPYTLLMERTGQPMKVCCRAMERAADRGLVEYGVSLRTGWLTDKGQALLAQVSA